MRKSCKKIIVISIILSVLITFTCCFSCLYLCGAKEKKAKEYLANNYCHNEKVVYCNDFYVLVNGIKYVVPRLSSFDYYRVIARDENYLLCYFDAIAFNKYHEEPETHINFYKCEYESNNFTLVRQIPLSSILYHQKAIVIYRSDDGKLLKYNAIENMETEYFGEIPSATSRYSWRKEGVTFADAKFFITDLTSGKEIKLTDYKNNLLSLEPAKYLNDNLNLRFYKVITTEDKVYVQCSSAYIGITAIITTYEFDFDTGKFTFVDWIGDVDPETLDTYFL